MKLSNNPYRSSKITLPYICINNYFTEEELNLIDFICVQKKLNSATTVSDKSVINNDNPIRISANSFHEPTNENLWFFEKMNSVIEQINENIYGFELYGYKSFQYTVYEGSVGGKYDAHMDLIMTDDKPADLLDTRKLSLSLILSEPEKDFTGGQFIIYEGENPTHIPTQKGTIIFFPSFMLHAVMPVLTGTRKSIVIWVEGPKFK